MDFKLNTDHDIDITDYAMSVIDGDEAIKQRLLVHLLIFKGEWFLDTDLGIPYYQTIFQKGVSKDTVDAILKREIEGVEGISRITSFTSALNSATREYTCNFVCKTDTGGTIEVNL